MVASYCTTTPGNIDLLRRYVPGLAVYTHAQVAKHIQVDERGCWPWDGSRNAQDYGIVWTEGCWDDSQTFPAHRYLYNTLVGPIPYGYHVHHRCEYKPCWNLLHLEPVTPTEHKARHRPLAPRLAFPCDTQGQFLLFVS